MLQARRRTKCWPFGMDPVTMTMMMYLAVRAAMLTKRTKVKMTMAMTMLMARRMKRRAGAKRRTRITMRIMRTTSLTQMTMTHVLKKKKLFAYRLLGQLQ